MDVEKLVKTIIETYSEPKLDLKLLKKRGNSTTYEGWIIQKMKEARQEGNLDVAELLTTCYKKYNEFKTQEKILRKRTKGDGDIQYFIQPDSILVTYYQRFEEGEEPKEVRHEISKQEINFVIKAINELNEGKKIPTSAIAEQMFRIPWKKIFADRQTHIRLTHILGILNHYGITHYSKRGFTTIIKQAREIQEVL
jgi:hypothetical protein